MKRGQYPFSGPEYDQIATGGEDVEFWTGVVEQIGGSVLELGVGAGRLAVELCGLSDDYHGLDQEVSMLDVARAKSEVLDTPLSLHAGSFIDLDLSQSFDLIFIPANTISHVVTKREAERFFTALPRHLVDGGVFMLDTFNPVARAGRERYELNRYVDPEDEQVVVVYSSPQHVDGVVTHHLEHVKDGSCFRRSVMVQRLWQREQLGVWLERVGLHSIDFFGDYAFAPHRSESRRLIARACASGSRKP